MADSKRPPLLALAADLAALLLLAAGAVALLTPDLVIRIAGVRVSLRTPWRPFAFALVVLIVRNLLVRRPASFAWAARPFRKITWTRVKAAAAAPLLLEEHNLFEPTSRPARLRLIAALVVGFSALTAALTWPQVAR